MKYDWVNFVKEKSTLKLDLINVYNRQSCMQGGFVVYKSEANNILVSFIFIFLFAVSPIYINKCLQK